MNPEEEFERWYISDDKSPRDLKSAQRQAYFAGHHQGMTRAAEIAAQNTHLIANAILTDRDKDK